MKKLLSSIEISELSLYYKIDTLITEAREAFHW